VEGREAVIFSVGSMTGGQGARGVKWGGLLKLGTRMRKTKGAHVICICWCEDVRTHATMATKSKVFLYRNQSHG
jgi:hypothetical protein